MAECPNCKSKYYLEFCIVNRYIDYCFNCNKAFRKRKIGNIHVDTCELSNTQEIFEEAKSLLFRDVIIPLLTLKLTSLRSARLEIRNG